MDLTQVIPSLARLNPFASVPLLGPQEDSRQLEGQTTEHPRLAMINRWLETAKFASSLHNSQEWQVAATAEEFSVGTQDFTFRLRLPRDKKYEILAPSFRLHYCSLGCLAENIARMAELEGYRLLNVRELHSSGESQFALHFVPASTVVSRSQFQKAVQNILRRHVNRNPYSTEELKAGAKQAIQEWGTRYPNQKTQVIEGKDIRAVAKAFAGAESKIYGTKSAVVEWVGGFQFLGKARTMQEGLHPSSLAMPLPTRFLLGVLKISSVGRFVFSKMFSAVPALVSRQLMQKSGALILLSADQHDPTSWFQLGRTLQGLWIELNKMGIAVQPMMGGPALIQSLGNKEWETNFPENKLAAIREVSAALKDMNLDLSRPSLLFRVGYAKSAQTVSPRKDLKLEVE